MAEDAERQRPDPEADEAPWLDRGPGSGSLTWAEAMQDSTARRSPNDGRGATRTTFYSDSDTSPPNIDRTWEELAALNDDMYHPDRGKQNHQSDKDRIIEIFTSNLECTSYQRDRVAWIIEDLGNLRDLLPTVSIEEIVLGTISLVVDEETSDFDNWIVRRGTFRTLMEDLDMKVDKLWTIRRKVREESTAFQR